MMQFDGRLYDLLQKNVARLGGQLSSRASSDPVAQQIAQEAQLHAFMVSHSTLVELFRSIYQQSQLGADLDDTQKMASTVLTMLMSQKVLTREQAQALVPQFEASAILACDKGWLPAEPEGAYFAAQAAKLGSFYHAMNGMLGAFAARTTFTTGAANDQAA